MVTRKLVAGILILCTVALSAGCSRQKDQPGERTAPGGGNASDLAEVPRIVLDMIDAHGGMVPWRGAPTVSFEDEFSSPAGPPTISRVVVDQKQRRAYVDFPGTNMSVGWDGKRAWGVNWVAPYPPRFIALLNYYFTNLPWLTMDPGVKLATRGIGLIGADSTEYVFVMMTFEKSAAYTPNDYYRLYIDPASKLLKAFAYVLTDPELLPPGVTSSPEHLVVYDSFATVNGLVVPTSFTIFESESVVAHCMVRNWAFDAPFDEARMTPPDSATVDDSTP